MAITYEHTDGNKWKEMLNFRGCIYPCGGEPILKTKPDGVFVAAHRYPVFLQCSECGYAPLFEQPELVKRYLKLYDMPKVGVKQHKYARKIT